MRRGSLGLRLALGLIVVVVAGFVALAVHAASKSTTALSNTISAGLVTYAPGHRKVPARVELPRLGGGAKVAVGGDTGRPVVVNFFASWCTACQKEVGAVAAVARSAPVAFVGVDTDDDAPSQALSMLRHAGATYPVGVAQAPLAEEYGTGNLPTTAFVNSRGQIVALKLGAVTRSELDKWVAELAAGKPVG